MKYPFGKILLAMLLVAFVVQSCSVKKYIPEGELLYTGATLDFKSEDSITSKKDLKRLEDEVASTLRPEPNSSFLGLRLGLLVHYKAQRDKPGFINKFLEKRIGEEPVYASQVNTEGTEEIIRNRMENRGFFFSNTGGTLERNEKKKKAKALYEVRHTTPYLMERFRLDTDSLPVTKAIDSLMDETLLDPGMRFDLNLLKKERNRLDEELKQIGYYNFNPDFLIFEADTNRYDNKRFDLFLRLKKDVPEKSTVPYRIRNIDVYPNYTVKQDSVVGDSIRYKNKTYVQEEVFFKPKRLDPFITIAEKNVYNPKTSRTTSRRLTSIGTYKFVNIRYSEIDSLATDSIRYLDASIELSPLKKRALRAELQGVNKSNNFIGPNLTLSLLNRNLFQGGESLHISGNIGYEMQFSGGDQTGLNSLQLGARTDLIFPRVLFPIKINENWFDYAIPKTKISLGMDYLRRSQLYGLSSVSSSFGYLWQANRFITHELDPIAINYVNLSNTTDEFEAILDDNPFLQNSFNQKFIAGLTYSFLYNGMVDQKDTHQFYSNFTLDVAGNFLDVLSGKNEGETKTFLGLEYAQYAKADIDLRYHLRTGGSGQKLAARIFAGIGVPYGNSETMPFSKQYFSGGPYSVRAFRIRSLGPGTYQPENGNDAESFFDQTGNIRLEANVEYRFPIISFLKGALFTDAGNVWNTKENNSVSGGRFTSGFLNEMGIGSGAGLRIDIQGFVIRFDLAAPIRKPWLPENERWGLDYKNPILNFAIGYPF